MKKLLSFMLICCLAIGLAACSNSGDGVSGDYTLVEDGLVEDGKLILATNAEFPPFEYFEEGEITGFDIEVAQEIATALGLELQVDHMDFDAVVETVKAGRADIAIAGLTVNETRLNEIDFSNSYYSSTQMILVPNPSDIEDASGLYGMLVGVQLGTTGATEIAKPDYGATPELYAKPGDAVEDLKLRRLHAVVIDANPAKVYAEMHPDTITLLDEALTEEDYAIGINKSNPQLTESINQILADLEASGKMQELKEKYSLLEAAADDSATE